VVMTWCHVVVARRKLAKKFVMRRRRRGEEGLRNCAMVGFLEVCSFVGMVSGVAKKNRLPIWAVEVFWRGSIGDCAQLLNSGYPENSFLH
jgi:hypothetical protein